MSITKKRRTIRCVNCNRRAGLTRGALGWTVKPSCECNPAAQIDLGCSRVKALDYFAWRKLVAWGAY